MPIFDADCHPGHMQHVPQQQLPVQRPPAVPVPKPTPQLPVIESIEESPHYPEHGPIPMPAESIESLEMLESPEFFDSLPEEAELPPMPQMPQGQWPTQPVPPQMPQMEWPMQQLHPGFPPQGQGIPCGCGSDFSVAPMQQFHPGFLPHDHGMPCGCGNSFAAAPIQQGNHCNACNQQLPFGQNWPGAY